MQLHLERADGRNVINAQGIDGLQVNGITWHGALLIPARGAVTQWTLASLSAFATSHTQQLLALAPELVLLGTGAKQQFIHPRLLAPLQAAGIGVDPMTTQAACRTFNILVLEGRNPLLALAA